MSIQSNFNQSLSLVSLLAGMSPTIKAYAERNTKLKSLTIQKKRIEESTAKGVGKVPFKDTEAGASEITRLSKEIFETSPTEENLSSYLSSLPDKTTAEPATADEIAEGAVDDVIQEELEEEDRKRAYEERKASFRTPREEAERRSVEALETRRAEEAKSRDFAKMVTEGVYSDFTDVRPRKEVK